MSAKPLVTSQLLETSLTFSRSRVSDFVELVKLRLTLLVLVSTASGYYLNTSGALNVRLLLSTLLGTALVAFGAHALNQVMEREFDARMERTKDRPVASGRMLPGESLLFGIACAAFGTLYLALSVNWLTSYFSLLTLTTYLFLYTPLKRVSSLSTMVGALPGALPVVLGSVAAQGHLGMTACVLFAIQYLWQLPHFLAIGWMYRDDYARGGYPILPVIDREGKVTGRQMVIQSVALFFASILPVFLGMSGRTYPFGACALGCGFLFVTVSFASKKTHTAARRVFLYSVLYLPLLLGWLVLDKALT